MYENKTKIIRLDFIFSYWIFLWYILYFFKFVKYSPKFILSFAMIDNALLFITLLYKKSSYYDLIKFFSINTFIKYLPLYTLRDEKIKREDIMVSILLLLFYFIYVFINNNSFSNIYNKVISGYSDDKQKYKTPISILYDNINNTYTDRKEK